MVRSERHFGVDVVAVMVVYRVSLRCLETVSGGGFYRKRKRLLRPSERIDFRHGHELPDQAFWTKYSVGPVGFGGV